MILQLFRSWNTAVKLAWEVPRSTFTYLVEGFLAGDQISLRNQILSRYPGFFRGLFSSPSREVRLLARLVKNDPRSTTCRNLRYIRKMTGLQQAESFSSWRIKGALGMLEVPENEKWRLGLLTTLITMRQNKYTNVQDSKQLTAMIASLSST